MEFSIKEGKTRESFVTVKNDSDQTQTFELFVQGAELNQHNKLDFVTNQNLADSSANWIKLSTTELTLAAGESQKIPFEITTPKIANRGQHHALIIAKPIVATTPDQTVQVINQKGIEVITEIPGPAEAQIALINESQIECGPQLCFDYTFHNQGTTEGSSTFHFKTTNHLGKTLFNETKEINLDRNQQQKIHIEWQPPSYGDYQTFTEIKPLDAHTSVLHLPQNYNFSFLPIIEIFIAGLILFVASSILIRRFQKLKNYFQKRPKLQFGLFSTLIIAGIIGLYGPDSNSNQPATIFAQEDAYGSLSENYVTLQWGNIHQTLLPQKEKLRNWNFQISSTNAEIYIDSHLDFENSDLTTFTNENQTLQINSITDEEIDGMILMVRSTKSETPILTFTDLDNGDQIQYRLTDLFTEQEFISGRQGIEIFASDTYFKAKRFYVYSQDDPLDEIINATEDINALLELPASPQIDAGEVTRIFALLPATYEAFTELRPTYDLISKVVAASGQVQVFADPIFISEIAASPELLTEIATSPDRNFSFIPDRKLIFPSQSFDFTSEKILSIPVDELLFTHQKPGKVTTYIQTSDFVSLTNENTIEANNLCVIPGEINWIKNEANNYFVQDKYCFKSSTDQTYLIERFIGDPVTFKMRPTLELKIPEGTKPSTYRGILTFTEI